MNIAKKMRLKAEVPLLLLNCPPECFSHFDGLDIRDKLTSRLVFEQVVLFAEQSHILSKIVPGIVKHMGKDPIFWIAYPKKSGRIDSDMHRDGEWWQMMAEYGYEGVASAAIDDTWTALRFRKTEAIGPKLRDIPQEQRRVEGVDFVSRTVKLPADAESALSTIPGLLDFFYSMSFSHKKEYAESIAEAKKEETRIRRIGKMLTMVASMRQEKELKKKIKK